MNIYRSHTPLPPPEFRFYTGETAKSYEQCVILINKLDPFLGDFFHNLCYVISPESLQLYFDEKQIKMINHLLVWYYLLIEGHMPQKCGYDKEISGTKQFLAIDNLLDLLNPERIETIQTTTERLSFNDFAAMMVKAAAIPDYEIKTSYTRFFKTVAVKVIKHGQSGTMIENIKLLFDMDHDYNFDLFKEPFNFMDQIKRLRWLFFVSIAANTQSEVELELKGDWFEKYYKDFVSLMLLIKLKLSKMIRSGSKGERSFDKSPLVSVSGNELKRSWWEFMTPITYAKTYPWQPNWMPNGLNTCYLSSTIWPLSLLINDKIWAKIQGLSDVNNLKETFTQLYLKVANPEVETITKEEVNKFRRAMQLSFPHHFIAPHEVGQEDAYEFLVCMLTDLLSLNSEKEAPRFRVMHTFARADNNQLLKPNDYNYADALAPSCTPEQSQVLDIRLDEGKQHYCHLRDLVTRARQTEIQERNAYRRAESQEGDKFLSFNATHTEQILVESVEKAPEVFIGRLTRFTFDFETRIRRKRFDRVCPDATLEFHVEGQRQQTVSYDLVAITVHSGSTIDAGHYYNYFRKQVAGKWTFFKWDDIDGPEICSNEQRVLRDVSENGYIFYYKKRQYGEAAPQELRLVEEEVKPTDPLFTAPRIQIDDWTDSVKNLEEAKNWIMLHFNMSYYVDEKQGYYANLIEIVKKLAPNFAGSFMEERVMNAVASHLKRSIYLIDCEGDRNLQIVENLYPIPGDKFRFGENYTEHPPLYLYVQKNGSYVELYRMEE